MPCCQDLRAYAPTCIPIEVVTRLATLEGLHPKPKPAVSHMAHSQDCVINGKLVKNQDCSPADFRVAQVLCLVLEVVCVESEPPDTGRYILRQWLWDS